jgi:hypothetical protein
VRTASITKPMNIHLQLISYSYFHTLSLFCNAFCLWVTCRFQQQRTLWLHYFEDFFIGIEPLISQVVTKTINKSDGQIWAVRRVCSTLHPSSIRTSPVICAKCRQALLLKIMAPQSMTFGSDGGLKSVFEQIIVVGCIHCFSL